MDKKYPALRLPWWPMDGTLPFNARDTGSIPGQGADSPTCLKAKKSKPKKRSNIVTKYGNFFLKDFKNGPHQKKNILKKNYFF